MPRYYSLHPFLPLPQVLGKTQKFFFSQPFLSSICLVLLHAVCPSLQGRGFPLVSNVVQFCTVLARLTSLTPGQGEVLHATAHIC